MFTENLREGFRSIGIARNLFIKMYNFVRFPVRPIYGGFPVKFRTHLGPPILYEEGVTPQQLQEKVAAAIEDLIVQNQRLKCSNRSNKRFIYIYYFILKFIGFLEVFFKLFLIDLGKGAHQT